MLVCQYVFAARGKIEIGHDCTMLEKVLVTSSIKQLRLNYEHVIVDCRHLKLG